MQNKKNSLTLFSLFMVIFLDVMGVILVLPVLTPLILQIDSTLLPTETSIMTRDFLYGISLAIFPFFMFFSAPVLGDLSDKFGRKNILLLCLVGSGISYLISSIGVFYNSLLVLLCSRAIAGIFAGTQPIASAAIIDVSTPETKTRHLSLIVLVSSAGIVFGPLLGGFTTEKSLVNWFSYETPFIFAGVLALINALFLVYTYSSSEIPSQKGSSIQLSKGLILFLSAFSNQKFRLLSLGYFSFLLAWCLYFQSISWFFMQSYHYGASKIGLFIGFIGIVFALASSVVARFALKQFKSEINALLFFLMTMACANIGSALTKSELSQWMWVILNATSDVLCYTISLSLFSSLANNKSQGWIMGVAGAIAAITWTVGGVIAGPLGYIDIRAPLWTAGILCLLGFVFIIMYQKNYQVNFSGRTVKLNN